MSEQTKKPDLIYRAVFDVIMDLRVALARQGLDAKIDVQIAQAMDKAASAAVMAYKTPRQKARGSR